MQSDQWQFGDWEQALEHYYREGLTDGLPLSRPRRSVYRPCWTTVGLHPEIFWVSSRFAASSFPAEKAAVSAVMAGCLPEHFPVVAAAVSAVCDRAYNFPRQQHVHQRHRQPHDGQRPLCFAHRDEPRREPHGEREPGQCLHRQGNQFVEGQLLRLSSPGNGQELHRHPGKYSYCFAEDLETSPWPSLAESQGFHPGASTVTIIAANAPLQLETHGDKEPEGFLTAAAHAMLGLGPSRSDLVLIISQELMAYVADSGWSREQVARFLYEKDVAPCRGVARLAAH